jgi:hypothetical protein
VHGAPSASATPEPPPLLVEYVVIHRRWVEKVLPASSADVKAWSEAPENAEAVTGAFRHILIKVPGGEKDPGAAAKKKAQSLLARLDKGEDFAKLAKQASEDQGSKENGGEYSADKVKELPEPLRAAFAALEPGGTTRDPVRSAEGLHLVHKERASDERIERAYRKAKAPELAKKLGDELLQRMKGTTPARTAIADVVDAVLGERAANDANRPNASLVDRDRLPQVRLTAAAKAALETFVNSAHPGDALPSPAVDGDTMLVARAVAPGNH